MGQRLRVLINFREVIDRRIVLLIIIAEYIRIMRICAAKLLSLLVHPIDKALDVAVADIIRQGIGRVAGRRDEHAVHQIQRRHPLPFPQLNRYKAEVRDLVECVLRHRDLRIGRIGNLFRRHNKRHYFCGGGLRKPLVRIFLIKGFPIVQIDQDRRRTCRFKAGVKVCRLCRQQRAHTQQKYRRQDTGDRSPILSHGVSPFGAAAFLQPGKAGSLPPGLWNRGALGRRKSFFQYNTKCSKRQRKP